MQSLAAVFSLPAIPTFSLSAATASAPAAAAVPAKARFWGIYMTALHGECPPHALESILNIPAVDANKYVTQLIADGVIKPNPLLKSSVSELVKANEDSLLGKVKERLKMKAQANTQELEILDTIDADESLDADAELSEESPEIDQDILTEDGFDEAKTQERSETEAQI